MGRSNVSGEITLVISEICMTSSNAATRGITFFPVVVAGATMASKLPASETISAASGSASWCSYGAASASNTFVTPSSLAAASATDLQSLPATSTCTSPPIALAAVSALAVASLRVLLSCSATRSVVISEHPRFVFKLADQFGGRSDFDPGFAPWRISCLQYLQTRLDIHAISVRSFLVDRFFLRLHDVR